MGKVRMLLRSLCLLFVLISCQGKEARTVTVKQVLGMLEENADQPYGCRIVAELQTLWFDANSLNGYQASTEFYHEKRWVSCMVSDFAINLEPFQRLMEKRMNGIVHRLDDLQPEGELPYWECATFPKNSTALGGYDIYPPGGWDLCSQARGLLTKFPPEHISFVGEEMQMSWEVIPAELKQSLYDGFPMGGVAAGISEVSLSSLSMGIDVSEGVPLRFQYAWSNGESWSLEFQDFALLDQDYQEKVDHLRSRMNARIEIGCFCDGEIYDIELKLPGRD